MEDEEGCINVVVFKTALPYNEYFHPNIPNTFFSNSLIEYESTLPHIYVMTVMQHLQGTRNLMMWRMRF